jgi:hypothetical protein
VLRKFHTGLTSGLVIDHGDGTTSGFPEWMLDEQLCGEMVDLVSPRISVDALRQLRQLLDIQPVIRDKVSVCSQSEPAQGAADEPKKVAPANPAISHRANSRPGNAACAQPMPRVTQPVVDRGHQR